MLANSNSRSLFTISLSINNGHQHSEYVLLFLILSKLTLFYSFATARIWCNNRYSTWHMALFPFSNHRHYTFFYVVYSASTSPIKSLPLFYGHILFFIHFSLLISNGMRLWKDLSPWSDMCAGRCWLIWWWMRMSGRVLGKRNSLYSL